MALSSSSVWFCHRQRSSAIFLLFHECKVFRRSREIQRKLKFVNSFLVFAAPQARKFCYFRSESAIFALQKMISETFFRLSVPKPYIESKTLHSVGQIWCTNVKILHHECKKNSTGGYTILLVCCCSLIFESWI